MRVECQTTLLHNSNKKNDVALLFYRCPSSTAYDDNIRHRNWYRQVTSVI